MNLHPFSTLLQLLVRVVVAPVATCCHDLALCSIAVNRIIYCQIIDLEPGVEEYQSGLLFFGATFADSLGCSFFSVQVGRQ